MSGMYAKNVHLHGQMHIILYRKWLGTDFALKWSSLKTGGKIKGVPPLIGPKGLAARVLKLILLK